MRASMCLSRLSTATQYRLERLHRLYSATASLPGPQKSLQLAYIAIELDNLNICVLREFAISTMRGAKTVRGKRIRVNTVLGPEAEIAAYMLSVTNSARYSKLKSPAQIRRTDEQTIRDPKETEKILLASAATNIGALQNALALNSNIFRDLKYLRHFYAHRSKDTFAKVSASATVMGIYNLTHPDEVLMHVISGRPLSVLEQWIVEAKLFYELLME